MVNEELKKYVERELKKGFSAERIRETLIESKYETDKIDETIRYAVKKKRLKEGLSALLVLLILGGLFYMIINYYIEPDEYDDLIKTECKDKKGDELESCITNIAISNKDALICEKTDKFKEVCYMNLAINEKDESLCTKTQDKNVCLAIIREDESLCEKSNELKDDCYLSLARRKGDELLCEKAGSRKEACYFSLARIKKDISLCQKSGKFRESCLQVVK